MTQALIHLQSCYAPKVTTESLPDALDDNTIWHGTSVDTIQELVQVGFFPGWTRGSAPNPLLPQNGDLYCYNPLEHTIHTRSKLVMHLLSYAGAIGQSHFLQRELGLLRHRESAILASSIVNFCRFEETWDLKVISNFLITEKPERVPPEIKLEQLNQHVITVLADVERLKQTAGVSTALLQELLYKASTRKGAITVLVPKSELELLDYEVIDGDDVGDDVRVRKKGPDPRVGWETVSRIFVFTQEEKSEVEKILLL